MDEIGVVEIEVGELGDRDLVGKVVVEGRETEENSQLGGMD